MDQIERHPEEGYGENPNGLKLDLDYLKFTEFWIASTPSFRVAKAEEWIKAMEKIFSILACTNDQMVAFATYMLDAEAKFWWDDMKRLLEDY